MNKQLMQVLGAAGLVAMLGACTNHDARNAALSNSAAPAAPETMATTTAPAADTAVAPATVTSGTTTEVNDSVAKPSSETTRKSASKKVSHKTTINNESAPAAANEGDRNLRNGTVGSGTGSDTHSTISKGQTDNDPQQQ